MAIQIVSRLDEIRSDAWNALCPADGNPFLRHEFLAALERHGCVGERWGWLPRHLLLREAGRLVGAVPMYLKDNSYGEFVFDWSWADAYRRAGLAYYPKLVVGVPYTPATGPRLLTTSASASKPVRCALIEGALGVARESGVSSLHWLFTDPADTQALVARGLTPRLDCQFHWHNRGYRDFDDFLDGFRADKRKKIKRERRRIAEQGITIEVLTGPALARAPWSQFHAFYKATFDKRGGYPTLTRAFFEDVATALSNQVVLMLAQKGGRAVAGSLSLRSRHTLYGRHWGCKREFHSLHFETCYYAGIDYCISQGLEHFEPGAQGEHKLARGFLPAATHSAHWIADEEFAGLIGRYTAEERRLVEGYMREMAARAPFKH